ncbi:hypothetical protein Scep_011522 [Stephania cephalantha]|uniref:RING-type E3 ubiquitin transferase n=1 Tax=Stephania cephalantha TaxID=152367 RepID=A0AAP0P6K1_9MAGN
MSLYPVNDAHLSTSFDSIMRRRIGDHDTYRGGTLFPALSSGNIYGSHQDAQHVPHFLPTQLIDDVVILDALPDSNTNSFGRRNSRVRVRLYPTSIQQGGRIFSDEDMMAVQHRSFFEEQSRERKSGWSEEAILKSLKTRNYEVSQEAEICSICMDGIKVDEKIGSLSCGHEFHVNCIKDWLIVNNTCPICRRSALKN